MDTFKVRFWEGLGYQSQEPFGVAVEGFQAPGRMVLVVCEGTGWVQREDGTRETIEGTSVVIYDAGDWVEYGSDTAFRIELYGAAGFSEEQQTARLTQFLGQGADAAVQHAASRMWTVTPPNPGGNCPR